MRNQHRPLKYEVGDNVFLKVAPIKGMMRFGKKGKLSVRYVRLFEVIKQISETAY